MDDNEIQSYKRDDHLEMIPSLGKFVSELDLETIPDSVTKQAKLCIVDTIGCILAGSVTPEAKQVRDVEEAVRSGDDATVLGSSTTLTTGGAARVNGYMGDIFELNDLIGGHASIGNVTAALAVGESVDATGTEILKAVISGIEVTARVYSGYYPHKKPYTEAGMIGVGIPSTFGTTAVASVLYGLSKEQTTDAMAIGGALAGWCPAEAVFGDGGSMKPMLYGGWPASVGILAARYAQAGVTGPHELLESEIGFYITVSEEFDVDAVTDPGLWYLDSPRRKLHACCGYIHASIDAVNAVRDEIDGRRENIERITIEMPEYTTPAVSKDGPPSTPNEARFHAEYCVALAITGNEIILPDHSQQFKKYFAQDEIRRLIESVNIDGVSDIEHYGESRVGIQFSDGAVVQSECSAPRGSPDNSLDESQIFQKFQKLAKSDRSRAKDYMTKIKNIEIYNNCDWLYSPPTFT